MRVIALVLLAACDLAFPVDIPEPQSHFRASYTAASMNHGFDIPRGKDLVDSDVVVIAVQAPLLSTLTSPPPGLSTLAELQVGMGCHVWVFGGVVGGGASFLAVFGQPGNYTAIVVAYHDVDEPSARAQLFEAEQPSAHVVQIPGYPAVAGGVMMVLAASNPTPTTSIPPGMLQREAIVNLVAFDQVVAGDSVPATGLAFDAFACAGIVQIELAPTP